MPERRRGTEYQKGYGYRDEVDTSIRVDEFERAPDFDRPNVAAPVKVIGQGKSARTPFLDAVHDIMQAELREHKVAGDERQRVAGAIAAGQGEGIESIKKRSTLDDWIFGTHAKRTSAAKIEAHTAVNTNYSQKLMDMEDDLSMHPEEYALATRKEISEAAAKIDDPELRKQFVDLASQRAETLIAEQLKRHHEHLQEKAASGFRKGLLVSSKMAEDQLNHNSPAIREQAQLDVEYMFDINNRPPGMSEKAWHTNVARAIMEDVELNNSRTLYDLAKKEGVLDEMPQDIQTQLENEYAAKAHINDSKYIEADFALKSAITDDAISLAEFEALQMQYVKRWDLVHGYSDVELANQRARKKENLKRTTKKKFDVERAALAYNQADHGYLSSLTHRQRQDGAEHAIDQAIIADLQRKGEQGVQVAMYYEGLNEHEKASARNQFLRDPSNTQFLDQIVATSAAAGYPVEFLKRTFNDGTEALMLNDQPSSAAVRALETQRRYSATQPGYAANLVSDKPLLAQYNTLRDAGHSPESALALIDQSRKNPVKPQDFSKEDKDNAQQSALVDIRKQLYKDNPDAGFTIPLTDLTIRNPRGKQDIQNEGELTSRLEEIADIHMSAGKPPEIAYPAAAQEIYANTELVGNTAVVRGNTSLTERAGIHPGSKYNTFNSALTAYLNQDTDSQRINWTGDLSDYAVSVDLTTQAVRLTYSGDDAQYSNTIKTIRFQHLRNFTAKDAGKQTPAYQGMNSRERKLYESAKRDRNEKLQAMHMLTGPPEEAIQVTEESTEVAPDV